MQYLCLCIDGSIGKRQGCPKLKSVNNTPKVHCSSQVFWFPSAMKLTYLLLYKHVESGNKPFYRTGSLEKFNEKLRQGKCHKTHSNFVYHYVHMLHFLK